MEAHWKFGEGGNPKFWLNWGGGGVPISFHTPPPPTATTKPTPPPPGSKNSARICKGEC